MKKRSIISRLLTPVIAVLVGVTATVASSALPAQADTPSNNECTQAGYGSRSGPYHSKNPIDEGAGGSAYIYYRSTAPTNCAVFFSNAPGAPTQSIRVCLQRRSDYAEQCDPPARGTGPYNKYAGRVVINAPDVCVRVHGTIKLRGSQRSDTLNSGWVRCG